MMHACMCTYTYRLRYRYGSIHIDLHIHQLQVSIQFLLLQMHLHKFLFVHACVFLRCGDYAFLDFAGTEFPVQAGCSWLLPGAACKSVSNHPWFKFIPENYTNFFSSIITTAQEQRVNWSAMVESKRYLGSILGSKTEVGFWKSPLLAYHIKTMCLFWGTVSYENVASANRLARRLSYMNLVLLDSHWWWSC